MVDFLEIVRSFIDLMSVSIPLTLILMVGTIIGLFFFNYFQKKFQLKWLGASLASMVVFYFVVLLIIHLSNVWAGYASTDTNLIPPDIRANPAFEEGQPNVVLLLVSSIIKSLLAGIIFAILTLPFAFAGVALFDALHQRVKGVWSRIAVVCFLASIAAIILLGVFPWILVSLIYLAIFGL